MGSRNNGSVILAFLAGSVIGGLAGTGIALLYAPASGDKTRKRIRKASREVKEGTAQRVDQTREHVVELTDEALEKLEDARRSVIAAMEAKVKCLK